MAKTETATQTTNVSVVAPSRSVKMTDLLRGLKVGGSLETWSKHYESPHATARLVGIKVIVKKIRNEVSNGVAGYVLQVTRVAANHVTKFGRKSDANKSDANRNDPPVNKKQPACECGKPCLKPPCSRCKKLESKSYSMRRNGGKK